MRTGSGVITFKNSGFFEGYFTKDKVMGKGILVRENILVSNVEDEAIPTKQAYPAPAIDPAFT